VPIRALPPVLTTHSCANYRAHSNNQVFFAIRDLATRAADVRTLLISSRAGRIGYTALSFSAQGTKPHYNASKAGVLSLVKSLDIEPAAGQLRFRPCV